MTVEVYNNVMSLIQKLSSLYNKILLNGEMERIHLQSAEKYVTLHFAVLFKLIS